jgi:methionyl-tRNA formyltransferase
VRFDQDESLMTHCGKTKKEDGLVNPTTDDPQTLWNKYRAYYGWPGIYFMDTEGKRVKITKAEFIEKKFIIKKVIREGKPESDY